MMRLNLFYKPEFHNWPPTTKHNNLHQLKLNLLKATFQTNCYLIQQNMLMILHGFIKNGTMVRVSLVSD
jgi:hypothetical protein